MILIEHSPYDENSIAKYLGAAEYSYWFVRKAFRRVLARIGTLHSVSDPQAEVDAIYHAARNRGEACVFLSYNPPQFMPLGLECPTIPVFAWEYDTIPDEAWGADQREDWRLPFSHCRGAITHCLSSVQAVRRTMGEHYPIWNIPAPLHDSKESQCYSAAGWREPTRFHLDGGIAIRTADIDLSLFRPRKAAVLYPALHRLRRASTQADYAGQILELSGVVYTAVFNPVDGRKNWEELVTGFVWAFRDNEDATLILKITHADMLEGVTPVLTHLAKLGQFRCKLILIHGLISDASYAAMVDASSYVVNCSYGEGQCLPLMEFMSAGRPAIAPAHTAMVEYITPSNSFVLGSRVRLSDWPHDPRGALRCLHHKISFVDLVRAYRDSYRIARDEPDQYRAMSAAATKALEGYCSDEVVESRLLEVFRHATGEALPRAPAPGSEPADPEAVRHRDAWMAGWYQDDGTLYHGFHVGPQDIVLDTGDEGTDVASYCAGVGARIVRPGPGVANLKAVPSESVDRILCLEALDHAADPATVLSELARAGRPGAHYLISLSGPFQKALQDALPVDGSTIPDFTHEQVAGLIASAGLMVLHEDSDGFYRSIQHVLAWQEILETDQKAPTQRAWAATWSQVLAGSQGAKIQRALDQALSGRLLFVAAKPGGPEEQLPGPRPERGWPAEWGVADLTYSSDCYAVGHADDKMSGWYNGEAKELVPGFPVSEEDILLDVGCGGAGAAGFCASQGARIILADVDPDVVEKARSKIERMSPHEVMTLATDAHPLLLPPELVTRVMCAEVLEHVADPDAFVGELVRVGKPGALYVFTVPATLEETIQKPLAPSYYFAPPHHIRIFQDGELQALIERSGLTVERSRAHGFYGSMWITFLWQLSLPINVPVRHKTFDLWAATWKMVLEGPQGFHIQQTLDSILPKRQIVVARKPE